MERLEEDTLYVAATRPALVMGVPLVVAAVLLMIAGLVIIVIQNPLYEMLMGPLPSAQPGHLRRGPGFVKKHKAMAGSAHEWEAPPDPFFTSAPYVRPSLFGRRDRFF